MKKTGYEILFIDDQIDRYLPILQKPAQFHGIKIFGKNSIQDGISFLKDYHSVTDAVILDLSFPDTEIQGIDGLKQIKILYPDIPVIIFTVSDSYRDLEKVVECIKAGAYSYFSKAKLDTNNFFTSIKDAISEAKEKTYQSQLIQERRKKAEEQKIPFLVYDAQKENISPFAVFGFRMDSVIRYEKEHVKQAAEWHQNLLKTINTPQNDISIKLKYIISSGKLNCYVLFILKKKTGMRLEYRVMDTQYDIQNYFYSSFSTYIFSILNEQEIKEVYESAESKHADVRQFLLYRPSLPLLVPDKISRELSAMGIKMNDSAKLEFRTLSSANNDLYLNEELFQALNYQSWAEIEIDVRPKAFKTEEIDELNHLYENISQNFSSFTHYPQINQSSFMPEGEQQNDVTDTRILIQEPTVIESEEVYKAQLEAFLTSLHDKFRIRMLIKRKGESVNRDFLVKLSHYFFGKKTSVNYITTDFSNPSEKIKKKEIQIENENSTTFLYDNFSALQIFRLPYPDAKERFGIKTHLLSDYFIPQKLPAEGILLGIKDSSNKKREIRITESALSRHLYVMGQTGTGKTTLLKTMIKDALMKNKGFALIDPHGDLYNEILSIITEKDRERLIIVDTSNPEESYKFNPMVYDKNKPHLKSLIINEFIRAFENLYLKKSPESLGPAFELYFKHAMLLVMDEGNPNPSTLMDVKKVFQDSEFRNYLLEKCTNIDVLGFFMMAMNQSGEQVFENYASYITCKLNRFIDDYFLSPILTGNTKLLNFREIIDENKILLVKMDKGLIGADNASLLGQIIISNISLAAMSRTNINVSERKSYLLFIDEFQNFIQSDVSSALSEVRKYGLSLVMANQTMLQLSNEMRDALLGNVGSMVFFRPGINDYETIRHYLEPDFKREEVLKLPNFNCISRLLIDNLPSDPFVFQTKYEI